MFKQEKGVTLVALVITIIVLLILAGVSIAMISGQDGIATKASKAARTDAIAAGKDAVNLAASNNLATFYDEKYVQNKTSDLTYATAEAAALAAKSATSDNVTISNPNATKTIKVEFDASNYSTGTVDANGGITWVDTIQ